MNRWHFISSLPISRQSRLIRLSKRMSKRMNTIWASNPQHDQKLASENRIKDEMNEKADRIVGKIEKKSDNRSIVIYIRVVSAQNEHENER